MRLAFAVLFVLLGFGAIETAAIADEARPVIPAEWLQRKLTIAEAEAEHPGITDERIVRVPDAAKPFGFQHREWEEFKASMLPGDEIWTFSSPPETWQHLAGRAGLALVRKGVPIRTIVTVMN